MNGIQVVKKSFKSSFVQERTECFRQGLALGILETFGFCMFWSSTYNLKINYFLYLTFKETNSNQIVYNK